MCHSEVCPVCGGTGVFKLVKYRQLGTPYPFVSGPIEYYSEKTCHGCQGKGWISVEDPPFNPVYYGTGTNESIITNHTISNHIPNIL